MNQPQDNAQSHNQPGAAGARLAAPTLLGGFVFQPDKYPSGLEYLTLMRGKTRIGSCCIQPSGGYIVWGKRKPVATLYDAALQMLNDHLNRCRTEETKWRKMLTMLKNEQRQSSPNTSGQPRLAQERKP